MLFEIFAVTCLLLLTYYAISKKIFGDYNDPFDYWKDKNVPSPDKKLQQAYNWNEITRKRASAYRYLEEYKMYPNQRFYGGYDWFSQVLTIRDDFDLIKSILVDDFDHFQKTRFSIFADTLPVNRTEEIVFKSTTVVYGKEWKKVRSVFKPIFNMDNLELMIPSIRSSNAKLEKLIDLYAADSSNMELKGVFGLYVMDVNVSCVFGVDSEVFLQGKRSPYIKHVKHLLHFDFFHLVRSLLSAMTNPTLKRFLIRIGLGELVAYPNGEHFAFFLNVIEDAFKVRLKSKIKRNDMIDMMINAIRNNNNNKNNTNISFTHNELLEDNKCQLTSSLKRRHTSKENLTKPELERLPKSILKHRRKSLHDCPENTKQIDTATDTLDYDYVIANAAIMLEAGYDVNAIIMSFVIYFLAIYPDCQRKLQDELDSNDVDDYHVLENLAYLDAVLNEALRIGSVFPVIERVCSKSYHVPRTNIVIEKDQKVKINVMGILNDEKYFPNPHLFNPENFINSCETTRNPFVFLPFSAGPRNCPAYKYANLEIKMCLAHILSKFDFYACEKTSPEFEIDNANYLGGIKGGFWVKCRRRTSIQQETNHPDTLDLYDLGFICK